jgi:hypothetical protein
MALIPEICVRLCEGQHAAQNVIPLNSLSQTPMRYLGGDTTVLGVEYWQVAMAKKGQLSRSARCVSHRSFPDVG